MNFLRGVNMIREFGLTRRSVRTGRSAIKVFNSIGLWVVLSSFHLAFAQNPVLSGGRVDPTTGSPQTQFSWFVDYVASDAKDPASALVFIDDSPNDMALDSGVADNGTYRFGPNTLSAGAHTFYFSFTDSIGGEARFPEAGTLSGPDVTIGAVTGTVADSDIQSAIQGATVSLMNCVGSDTGKSAQTGLDGTFTISDVADGDYFLTIDASGFDLGRDPSLNCFSVSGGTTVDRGTILLIATAPDLSPVLSNGMVDPATGASDTEFNWSVDYFSPGAEPPDIATVFIDGSPSDMTLQTGTADDGTYQYGPQVLSPGLHTFYFSFSAPSGTTRLPAEGSLLGPSVDLGTIQGLVENADGGTPIEGALLTLLNCDETAAGKTALTGSNGAFIISNVLEGDYFLSVTRSGFDSARDPQADCFTVSPNATEDRGTIMLQPTPVTPSTLSNGRVDPASGTTATEFNWLVDFHDTAGQAPMSAQVFIDEEPTNMTLDTGTAGDGTYRFGPIDLATGAHTFGFSFSDSQGTPLMLPESGTFPGPEVGVGMVQGVVAAAEGGDPLQDATVTLKNCDGSDTGMVEQTDTNGAFTFSDVAAGDYFLAVEKSGFVSLRDPSSSCFHVASDQTEDRGTISLQVFSIFPPQIGPIPDIVVGDREDSSASQDNNFFRFNQAFNFSNYVQDADTPSTAILWSFMEATSSTQVSINAKHQLSGADNPTSPGSKELTGGGANLFADIRLISLSPEGDDPPFADPGPAGSVVLNRAVTFFATDGDSVASRTITMYGVEDGFDRLTSPPQTLSQTTFDANVEGWTSLSFNAPEAQPLEFSGASASYQGDRLELSSPNNASNYFGQWASPANIPYVADRVYRASWEISTNQATASAVPSGRFRISSTLPDVVSGSSMFNAVDTFSNVPPLSPATKTYVQYFEPVDLSALQANSSTAGLNAYFDIIDFGPTISGSLFLDGLTIETVDPPLLEESDILIETFNPVQWFVVGGEQLFPSWQSAISAGIGTETFSWTINPGSTAAIGVTQNHIAPFPPFIPAIPGQLYRATFSLSIGDSADRVHAPRIRLRLQDDFGETASEYDIMSRGGAISVPNATPTLYNIYLVGPDNPGTPLNLSFGLDVIAFGRSESGTIEMEEINLVHGNQP